MNNPVFEITIIGNGAAMPMAGKYHSSHVLNLHEQFFLIDCGEGTQKGVLENHINPQKIKAVFISHLHGDHIYGLFPLIDTLSLAQRSEPLMIFAPDPMHKLIDCFANNLYGNNSYDMLYYEVETSSHRKIYENNDMEVWTIPLIHRIPATGYLFREKNPGLNIRKEMVTKYALDIEQIRAAKRGEDILLNDYNLARLNEQNNLIPDITSGVRILNKHLTYKPFTPRSYAYCSDTIYSELVSEMVRGVDLLYHEATFGVADTEIAKLNGHSTSIEAAGIARLAGVKRLLIGHISGRYKDTSVLVEEAQSVFPNTEEAMQGKTYSIKT